MTEFLYNVGAHARATPVAQVWVTSHAAVSAARRAYAAQHGLEPAGVWSEQAKAPSGPISRDRVIS